MSLTNKVDIVIYDAPTGASSGCACGCSGHDHGHGYEDPLSRVSMEMQTRALAMTLERAFPGQVRVEYINVLKDPRGPHLPQTKLLCSMTYPTPLVYVNGQGRFAGAIPAERIREEIENILGSRE